ncbi:MAG: TonB-dependent receptor [Burkholderiales bacterium]|nr:TonB-dependent receptor [Burkholderiales bacterium]MDE2158947.1 TonB-dependent receptor [Burkholderiales bacterium]MDE2503045.1 TonB-dependent receptor [Burkholderiales bacterium]
MALLCLACWHGAEAQQAPEDAQAGPQVQALPSVTVTADRSNLNASTASMAATRIPTKPIDSARNIQIFSDADIRDRGDATPSSALQDHVSGIDINPDNESPNRSNYMIRGYEIDDDWGTKIDGQQHLEWTDLDLYDIDHIEIIKGPSAATAGISDPGGFVNFVTKKADWTHRGEFNQTVDTRGGHVTNIQQNYVFSEAVAGRSVATASDAYAPQLNGNAEKKRLALAQNFMFRIGRARTLQFDLRHVDDRQNYGADSWLPAQGNAPAPIDLKTNMASPQDRLQAHDTEVAYQFNDELGPQLSLHHDLKYQVSDRDYHYMMPYQLSGNLLQLSYYDYNNHKTYAGTDNFLTFKGDLYARQNEFVVGFQLLQSRTRTGSNSTSPGANDNCASYGTFCVDIFQPSYAGFNWVYGGQAGAAGSGQGVNSGRDDNTAIGRFTQDNVAIYVQDQWHATDRLLIDAGLRYTRTENRGTGIHDTKVEAATPDIGLSYKLLPTFSVYADYATGFMPQTQVDTSFIAPQHAYQDEAGFKWIDDRYSLTASWFDMQKTNDATFSPGSPDHVLYVGKLRISGVEIDASYRLPWIPGVRLALNYAGLDSRVSADLDPTLIGKEFPSIPPRQFGSWIQYDATVAGHAYGLAAGLSHVGRRYADVSNTITIPGYTKVDAMAYLALSSDVKLRLNLTNVGNVKYYAGASSPLAIMQGAPFVGLLSLNVRY